MPRDTLQEQPVSLSGFRFGWKDAMKDESPQSAPIVLTGIPQTITVTLKQDSSPQSPKSDFERTARILSLVAIPVVLAIVGALIQGTLNRTAVRRDYVQLAVSVLTSEK